MSGGMGGGEAGVDPPTTTKGDLSGFDTTFDRVPIGSNTQVLTADSTEALGLKWATPTDVAPPTTTKGDLSGFSTSQARIPIGSNTQVLTADSTEALGLKWATAGGVTLSNQEISPTGSQTTTSTSAGDIAGGSITLANRTGGKAFCHFFANIEIAASSNQYNIGFELDGTEKNMTSNHSAANNVSGNIDVSQIFDLEGGTLQLRWRVAGSTASLANGTINMSRCTILEIS